MSAKRPTPLRSVPREAWPTYYTFENPVPCTGCCRVDGHPFAALVMTIRRGTDGAVLKVLDAAPGGYRPAGGRDDV